jgi:hypothetical protein
MTAEAFQHIFLPLIGAGGVMAVIVFAAGMLAKHDGEQR